MSKSVNKHICTKYGDGWREMGMAGGDGWKITLFNQALLFYINIIQKEKRQCFVSSHISIYFISVL